MSTLLAERSSAPSREDRRPHAVVIGAGFGGLAAAVRLGARGYRVTMVEKLDAPGGRAYVHRQDGFTFDAGPTIITAPFVFEELWTLCGKRMADDVTLVHLELYYRLMFDDGAHFDTLADDTAMRAEVARLAPGDVKGYEHYLAHAKGIYTAAFERLAHMPFNSFWDMLRAAPALLWHGGLFSVHRTAAWYIRNEKLRMAMSFHPLFVGGNPYWTTSAYCLINHLERLAGVHFAMGGTGALVAGLARLVEGQGGRIRTKAEVAEILAQEDKACGVRLTSGEIIHADIVVSNADPSWTYAKLMPRVKRRTWTDGAIGRLAQSMGVFVWCFGTDRQYTEVPHHTILLGPRYKGLLTDIFWNKRVAEDFSLYIHRPTATDPSLAPTGCDTFYALSPVPNLSSGTDWGEAAEPYRRAIERRLEERLLPGMSRHIVTSRLLTPQDFEDRLLSWKGAAFGPQPVLWQSAWFRPHNKSEELDRLFFVGAGTHPGPGVPGVISSAKVLDSVVPHASALV